MFNIKSPSYVLGYILGYTLGYILSYILGYTLGYILSYILGYILSYILLSPRWCSMVTCLTYESYCQPLCSSRFIQSIL